MEIQLQKMFEKSSTFLQLFMLVMSKFSKKSQKIQPENYKIH